MKYTSRTALAGVLATSMVSVHASGSPAKLQARATSVASASLPTITVMGNAFWNGTDRFYINGVDYQPGGSSANIDPLANEAGCARDVPEFQKLGINAIRVYEVDNTANHDACMYMLAAAGIYVALDVNTPLYSLNRNDPAPSYNAHYLQSIFATMDAFAGYSNTLVFFSGNEVVNMLNNTNAAPYVKAVTRDMIEYRTSRGYRAIPIGYSATQNSLPLIYEMAQYFDCGPDYQRSDFFAFNDYQWCNAPAGQPATTIQSSGYDILLQNLTGYAKPIFFSEYGCNTNLPRDFGEVDALLSSEMTPVFSGGLIYEYSEEGNDYGIVQINGNSVDSVQGQFAALQSAIKAVTLPPGNGGAVTTSGSPAACPSSYNAEVWPVSAFLGTDLPAQPTGVSQFFQDGAGKGPGLSGPGSQNAGGGSNGVASPVTTPYQKYATQTAGPTSTKSKGAAGDLVIPPFSFGALCTMAAVFVSSLIGAVLL